MKAAVFDIETTDLAGVGAGIMVCACVRPLSTKRTRTFRLQYRDEWNPAEEGFLETEETDLVRGLVEELGKYDLLIGHNIEGFDLPFIRSRAEARGVACFLNPFTYDTMKAWGRVRLRTRLNGFGKPSKSLAMIADFLGVDQEKTAIYPREWWMTVWGKASDREHAMQEIVSHCEKDVRMNASVYEIVLPMDKKGSIKRWM